ncbi:hypothetical protein PENTCL1PPCAC_18786, partial [Pristionchus entomophagus]
LLRKSPFHMLIAVSRHIDHDDRTLKMYRFTYCAQSHEEDILGFLGECMGRRIDDVDIDLDHVSVDYLVVEKLLSGIKFEKLKVNTHCLSDTTMDFMLTTVKEHNVNDFTFDVHLTTLSGSVKFLRALSEILQSLSIIQSYVHDIDQTSNYMLGQYDLDWAEIILDLFSGTVDKLSIKNEYFPSYLSEQGVDCLRERLPKLDKRIWFEATYNTYDRLDYKFNDYVIRMHHELHNRNSPRNILRIKHSTRHHEGEEIPVRIPIMKTRQLPVRSLRQPTISHASIPTPIPR